MNKDGKVKIRRWQQERDGGRSCLYLLVLRCKFGAVIHLNLRVTGKARSSEGTQIPNMVEEEL